MRPVPMRSQGSGVVDTVNPQSRINPRANKMAVGTLKRPFTGFNIKPWPQRRPWVLMGWTVFGRGFLSSVPCLLTVGGDPADEGRVF